MSQITIRDLPEVLERRIRSEARRRGASLNKTIISILESALGMKPAADKKRDLSAIAGTWDQAEADGFDEAVRVFERIDEENWKS